MLRLDVPQTESRKRRSVRRASRNKGAQERRTSGLIMSGVHERVSESATSDELEAAVKVRMPRRVLVCLLCVSSSAAWVVFARSDTIEVRSDDGRATKHDDRPLDEPTTPQSQTCARRARRKRGRNGRTASRARPVRATLNGYISSGAAAGDARALTNPPLFVCERRTAASNGLTTRPNPTASNDSTVLDGTRRYPAA